MVTEENPIAITNSAIVMPRRTRGVSQVACWAWSQARAPVAPVAAAMTHPAHMWGGYRSCGAGARLLVAAVFAGAVEDDFVVCDAHRDAAAEVLDCCLECVVGEWGHG